jgi:hypothetical protein
VYGYTDRWKLTLPQNFVSAFALLRMCFFGSKNFSNRGSVVRSPPPLAAGGAGGDGAGPGVLPPVAAAALLLPKPNTRVEVGK